MFRGYWLILFSINDIIMFEVEEMKNRIKRYAHYLKILITIRTIGLFTSVKKNRVLFLSDVRENLGGNLEMMDNYIQDEKYEKVYCLKKSRQERVGFKKQLKKIYLICTSEYILLDDFCSLISFMKVKKNQKVCQLWHGPGAFKKFGIDRKDKKIGRITKYLTHRNYTHAIVTSEEITGCYASAFGMNEKDVHVVGFPRTDIFFDKKHIEETRKKLYKEYPQFKNKKVIMFAPTYRGVSLPKSYYDYDKLDLDKIYKKLGKDYVFVIKMHPGLVDSDERQDFERKLSKYKDFYYNFTHYRDINDLLLITDILVTDYSSVVFDYLLVDKPIVYFTYDLEEYEEGRGLYYPFKDYVYGEIAKSSDELVSAIKKENMCVPIRKKFKKQFMSACDGNSTKKTYDLIFK